MKRWLLTIHTKHGPQPCRWKGSLTLYAVDEGNFANPVLFAAEITEQEYKHLEFLD